MFKPIALAAGVLLVTTGLGAWAGHRRKKALQQARVQAARLEQLKREAAARAKVAAERAAAGDDDTQPANTAGGVRGALAAELARRGL